MLGKQYELAIWFGVYVGLRVGEIQALRWVHIDLDRRVVRVTATSARKEKVMRDYPKGRKWHLPTLPDELIDMLRRTRESADGEFVCPSPDQAMLTYYGYYKALRRYCRQARHMALGIRPPRSIWRTVPPKMTCVNSSRTHLRG